MKVENFPYMGKEIVSQVQKARRVPGRITPRRNTRRHTVTELTKLKDKDKMLKAAREERQITQGLPSGYQLISQIWLVERNSTSQKETAWYI